MKKLILIFWVMTSFTINAKDLGRYGDLFPIIETDLMTVIETRLKNIQEQGGFENLKKDLQNKAINHRDRPYSVLNKKTTETNTRVFDPTITLNKDLKDHNGIVFAHEGEQFNPLNYIRLSKSLYFIDADDDIQIEWIKNKNLNLNDKVILTNGSTLKAEKELNRVVYFDQNGELIKRFNITAVPSFISQKNDVLVITEVYLND